MGSLKVLKAKIKDLVKVKLEMLNSSISINGIIRELVDNNFLVTMMMSLNFIMKHNRILCCRRNKKSVFQKSYFRI